MEREGREKGNIKLLRCLRDGGERFCKYFVYEWISVVYVLISRWSMKIYVVIDNYLCMELFLDM